MVLGYHENHLDGRGNKSQNTSPGLLMLQVWGGTKSWHLQRGSQVTRRLQFWCSWLNSPQDPLPLVKEPIMGSVGGAHRHGISSP